jgi:phosphoglycolate phosphatase-like HAD superfamily hydrolase
MVTMMAGGVAFEVEAVAFDKDGTLIDLDAAWGPAARAWVETAARGDVSLMAELAARMGLDLDRDHLVTGGLFAVGTLGQLHETTLQILEEKAIPDPGPVADAARHASARAGEEGRVVPLGDVVGTFRNLGRAGVKLAVVSSDDRSAIDDGIAALGVGPLIAAIVSGDQGLAPKPAPDSLLKAADLLGVAPSAMLYVGDSWVDAEAGRAAGTILVGEVAPEVAALASVVVPDIGHVRPA